MSVRMRHLSTLVFYALRFINAIHCLHVVIVSTSYPSLDRLTSLQHTKIGLDFAVQEFRNSSLYNAVNVNVTYETVYLEKPTATGCPDVEASISDVAQFYHRQNRSEGVILTFITPGCGDSLVLGSLVREWNIFMMTTGSMYTETRNRVKYPTMVSVSPIQASVGAEAVLHLFQKYHWTSISVIFDSAGVAGNNDLLAALKTQSQNQIPNVRLTFLPTSSANIVDLLTIVRSVSRIVYLSMHPTLVRKYLLTAKKMNMTNGEYVYFVPQLARSFINGNLTWQNYDQNDSDAFDAYRSLIQLTPCSPGSSNQQMEPFLKEMADISRNNYKIPFLAGDNLPTDVTTSAYYGFQMLNQVLHELLQNDNSSSINGNVLAEKFLARNFQFHSDQMYIDHAGQRRTDQCLRDLNLKTGRFEDTLIYDIRLRQLISVENQTMDWSTVDNNPPPNEPPCGFNGDNQSCQKFQRDNTMVTAASTAVSLIIILTVLFLLHLKRIPGDDHWLLDPEQLRPISTLHETRQWCSMMEFQEINEKTRNEHSTESYVKLY